MTEEESRSSSPKTPPSASDSAAVVAMKTSFLSPDDSDVSAVGGGEVSSASSSSTVPQGKDKTADVVTEKKKKNEEDNRFGTEDLKKGGVDPALNGEMLKEGKDAIQGDIIMMAERTEKFSDGAAATRQTWTEELEGQAISTGGSWETLVTGTARPTACEKENAGVSTAGDQDGAVSAAVDGSVAKKADEEEKESIGDSTIATLSTATSDAHLHTPRVDNTDRAMPPIATLMPSLPLPPPLSEETPHGRPISISLSMRLGSGDTSISKRLSSDGTFSSADAHPEVHDATGTLVSPPTFASLSTSARNLQQNQQQRQQQQQKQQKLNKTNYEKPPPAKQKKGVPFIPAAVSTADLDLPPDTTRNRVRLGLCAMDKKARSKPMAEILSRLDETLFEVVFFGDKAILESPVEEWPICEVLIAFYSKGYPLDKAERYAELRKPFVLNDLRMQRVLMDRRRVYDLLEASGIDVPRHAYMNRDGYMSDGSGNGTGDNVLIEHDDHIEVNGAVIHKPFVEKPVDAEDHNIAIYYPSSAGGGCKKLFRKVGDRSSEFYPDVNEVRRDGSYIYEEFVETQGTDVKMYTVGPDYGHAEARKSPTVDGKVERNSDGKEVRFPVILTLREKEIARRIVLVFKQQVCGFDLLRVQEGDSLISYVCDVNGWSFVKNSRKYYDDCAQILTEHMLAAVKPKALRCFSTLDPLMKTMEDEEKPTDTPKRHSAPAMTSMLQRASRLLQGEPLTPSESASIGSGLGSLHNSPTRADMSEHDTPLLSPVAATTLQEGAIPVREMPDMLTTEPASMCTSASASVDGENESNTLRPSQISEKSFHQEELRCIIAVIRHGDRTPKQKLKVVMTEPHILKYFHDHTSNCKKDLKVKARKPMVDFLKTVKVMIKEKEQQARVNRLLKDKEEIHKEREMLYQLRHMRDVLERWKIVGLNRKLQIKPRKWDETVDEHGETVIKCTELLLILKWGGNLTKLGERQAITLGQQLRHDLYPDAPGGGILRLHSTFRHDLKIKTSDEGRVMKTAAAFAKGLLELEGEIPPILVSLVHKEKSSLHMLDPSGNKEVKEELDACKEKINQNLQKDFDFDKTTVKEHEEIVGPRSLTSLHAALRKVCNPRKKLFEIHKTIGELILQLEEMLGVMTSGDENRIEGGEGLIGENEEDEALSGIKLYKGETLLELTERWRLLHRKLYDEEKDVFDLSRVPDVHDNVRFDMLHNPHLGLTSTLEKLYNLAKLMADCVVPQEYGTTIDEKRSIANKMCRALLEKIKYDLIIARTDNQVDMRYMINMEYSADLPINTMGRRVRTRLYFTSESHLHTLLNVLRFAAADSDGQSALLSKRGRALINSTPELCYLTQVIFRLFEDPKKDMDDPKRFRVEILFSPGATATPLHMAEMDRELDSARFDTTGLETISKENLTCQEVERYFTASIKEGKTKDDDDEDDIRSMATVEEKRKMKPMKVKTTKPVSSNSSVDVPVENEKEKIVVAKNEMPTSNSIRAGRTKSESWQSGVESSPVMPSSLAGRSVSIGGREMKGAVDKESKDVEKKEVRKEASRALPKTGKASDEEDEQERVERLARALAKQYFWKSIAAVSLVMGFGCLVLSLGLRDNMKYQRRWTRR